MARSGFDGGRARVKSAHDHARATAFLINDGVVPKSAIDSLDAARYLTDKEEYWPFEGDDWPDEFVGSVVTKVMRRVRWPIFRVMKRTSRTTTVSGKAA